MSIKSMYPIKRRITIILLEHATDAADAEQDTSVRIAAVGAAKQIIDQINPASYDNERRYAGAVIDALEKLSGEYRDIEGEFTDGRGDIQSVLGAIRSEYQASTAY